MSKPVVERLPRQLYPSALGSSRGKSVAEKHAWANIRNADLNNKPCAHRTRVASGCENNPKGPCSCPPTCVCWEPIRL